MQSHTALLLLCAADCCPSPYAGVEHIVWREEGTDDEKSRGEGTLEAEVEFVEDGQVWACRMAHAAA